MDFGVEIMINVQTMSSIEIWQSGLEALSRDLGPVGMVRFLQMFEVGKGDYTKDRAKWLPDVDVDELIHMMRESNL
jgi:hypothetical protein